MAKRFTDTEKWKKEWYRELPVKMKVCWLYILDNCDHAGFWEIDTGLMSFQIGDKFTLQEILKYFKGRIEVVGKKISIIKFIEFQYGSLKENNNLHRSIIQKVNQAKINNISGAGQGLVSGAVAPMEEEEEMDMEKEVVMEEDMVNLARFVPDFESVWRRYPDKTGKEKAKKSFYKSVKTEKDYQDINKALDNYLKCEKVLAGFIQNGSTWFNDWTGYLDMEIKEDAYTRLKKIMPDAFTR